MGLQIGVLAAEHIAAGAVEHHAIVGGIRRFPDQSDKDYLAEMPAEEIALRIVEEVQIAREGQTVDCLGVGFPGIIRDGVIEESPNLSQMKGQNFSVLLAALLERAGISAPVHLLNDADAMAAGIAAERRQLDRVVRVWFLGSGIGYGRYPQAGLIGEGGHTVVTLDPKEKFCQCGGVGHLEGIMGYRAMRRRFLDMEPDEVFEEARAGDARCVAFVELWHRALAAATATSIHYEGPGKFYISGPDSRFVQTEMLQIYLRDMVKMSSLQGSAIEVIPTSDEIAIVGAAVSAAQTMCARG
ncbi:MAG TPA: ROK family protein [Blastocatellia bacterium]|nr:ROK family protein [Blastocatellia bacterium]